MPVDKAEFRSALGHFAAGVTVVTAKVEDKIGGITVTAFSSLSLEPPLVLICIDKKARMHDRLPVGGHFAVNMLAEDQELVSREFASGKANPFHEIGYREGATGAPLIQGAIATIECQTVDRLSGGDHTIVVGQVEITHVHEGKPLLYFRGGYGRMA
jgi:flavin reductase (DIM6/NTAB) family NADH-FMN oxidoreductase RutF